MISDWQEFPSTGMSAQETADLIARTENSSRALMQLAGAEVTDPTAEIERLRLELAETKVRLEEAESALEAAKIDPVTGLKGPAAFKEEYESLFSRNEALAAIFVDINGLNRVNRSEGLHGSGNNYLRSAAQSLKSSIRPTDEVYRYGGDEFVVLIPEADEEVVTKLINRLRKKGEEAIAELHLPGNLYPGISVGGALRHSDDTSETLLARADEHCEEEKAVFYTNIERETGLNLRR